ncbi:hypothetical protein CTEN210_16511 [Chaetoceros tenuissimus]|uniref:Uncharacterized protein n=1 Tax=Chaetoceros tenuissimus TaxID=426638 RepID=A0AAD3HDN7_9STRA|nr:hypothetical protein CTEN210_16508 [Chaetoceros tenuissimus]GFH60035.1 hypothetical protein CTEN210_16511 [Chaetoceros tenuissimus]
MLYQILESKATTNLGKESIQLRSTEKILIISDTISNHSNDKKVESSCRRVCSGRPIKNKIYWAYGQAGLDDRKTIIHNLAQIAGFLCAEVVLPPPSRLLSPFHNNGMLIDDQLEWSDFSNLTFASDNQPVIKSGRDEFGQHFEDWHQFPLFDTVSETSKYQHWFHVVSKENDWKTDFQSILDYTYLQEEHHGLYGN